MNMLCESVNIPPKVTSILNDMTVFVISLSDVRNALSRCIYLIIQSHLHSQTTSGSLPIGLPCELIPKTRMDESSIFPSSDCFPN
mmetsp:Transcript_33878/g.62290  ORF Transcript_33878/g.62290 Transcript_33878/m.62290 type:complete len:85 (-) Transcript_33878:833-1087(-)